MREKGKREIVGEQERGGGKGKPTSPEPWGGKKKNRKEKKNVKGFSCGSGKKNSLCEGRKFVKKGRVPVREKVSQRIEIYIPVKVKIISERPTKRGRGS